MAGFGCSLRSSQNINPNYGFAFWVNTTGNYWPHAPKDAFAMKSFAINRCFVVPSLDLVVVRTGFGPQPVAPTDVPLGDILGSLIN